MYIYICSVDCLLEKVMAPHSSTLAWKIPWTEEPGRLQSMVSLNWRLSDFTFTFHFHTLEKEMATYSSVLAWRIPGTVESGGLPSMGLHRVGHDWSDLAAAAAYIYIHIYVYMSIYEYIYNLHYLFIYLFLFGCAGWGFLCVQWAGAALHGGYPLVVVPGFSMQWLHLLRSTGSRACRFH